MTIIDYLLISGIVAAAVYTPYRLFRGWRNSAFTEDESEIRDELNASPGRRMASSTPWNQHPKEHVNASNVES